MARSKKVADTPTSTAPKTRGIDIQEVEARVEALDKSKRRSYDIFDIEQRVYNLEKNSGGGGGTSFPYYETEDGKIGLMVINDENKFGVFYFKGVNIAAEGNTITDERMTPYIPAGIPGAAGFNGSMCKGYSDAESTTYTGDICFMNKKLQLLSTTHAQYASGVTYGCMIVCGDRGGAEYYMTQLTTYIPHEA